MANGRREKSSTLRAVTISVGIGMGVLLSIFTFFSNSTLQVSSSRCESSEIINELKKQVKELEEVNQEKKQIEKVELAFGINRRLAEILSKIGINKEIILVLANSNVQPMLEIQFSSIKRVGISNYLVVALDDGIVQLCKSNNVSFYKRDPDEGFDTAGRSHLGSVVSALKFRVLKEFLQMGYNVLVSDSDVIFIQNPFEHLYRDSDVESMSDGHDTWSAYGYNHIYDDPEMEYSRYVYTTRIWAFNSGFFYIRATLPAIELLDRVTQSLRERPTAWDQAVYNEELFLPSHPGYVGLTAVKRAMDTYLFMNSNVLFKTVRKDPDLRKQMPVVVHINYHLDKLPRMEAAVDFYFNGKDDALEPFSDGTKIL